MEVTVMDLQFGQKNNMRLKLKKTGEILDVADSFANANPDLFDTTQEQQAQQNVLPAVKTGSQMLDNTLNTKPQTITGYTLQQHIQALNAARKAGDKAAEADITDNYDRELEYQKNLASGSFDTPETKVKKEAQKKEIQSSEAQNVKNRNASKAAQDFLSVYDSVKDNPNSNEAKKKLAMAAAKYNAAVGFGEGGKTLSANEIGILAPTLISTERQREQNIIEKALGTQPDLTTGYLKESPAEAAQKMKYALQLTDKSAYEKYKEVGGKTKARTGNEVLDSIVNSEAGKYIGDTLKNAPGNVKDIINSALGLPASYIEWSKNEMKQGRAPIPQAFVGEMGINYVKSLNKDIGEPLQGGDILGRAAENFKERPVSTVLDVLPFLSKLKKPPVASEAGDVAEVAKSVTPPEPPGGGTKIPKFIQNIVEDIKGRRATSIAAPDPLDVTRSEKLMGEALKMTKSFTKRNLAKELESFVPKANEAIDAFVKANDKAIGLQPIEEISYAIKERLLKSSAGQAHPELVDKVVNQIEKDLTQGNVGKGVKPGTTLGKINQVRKTNNSSLRSWFENDKPTASATDNINALKWEASDELKNFLSDVDNTGDLKKLIYQEHVALETSPKLAKQVLNKRIDTTFWQAAYDKLFRGPISAVTEPIRIQSARMLQGKPSNYLQSILDQAKSIESGSSAQLK